MGELGTGIELGEVGDDEMDDGVDERKLVWIRTKRDTVR
jgi:hypothetical protein